MAMPPVKLTLWKNYHRVRKLNIARRHLTQEQKRGLIREQLKETPEKSDRQIAVSLGVDHKTVSAQRDNLERTGEIPQLGKTIGADGKERRKPVSVFNPSKREERAMLKNYSVIFASAAEFKSLGKAFFLLFINAMTYKHQEIFGLKNFHKYFISLNLRAFFVRITLKISA